MKVVIEKGRHRVVPISSSLRPNGEPLGFEVQVKRKGDWKRVAFKTQRSDALKLFGEKAKVVI